MSIRGSTGANWRFCARISFSASRNSPAIARRSFWNLVIKVFKIEPTVRFKVATTYYDVPKKLQIEMEEDKAEDEKVDLPKKSLPKRLRNNWHIAAKLVEMSLCITCVGLIYEPIQNPDIIRGHIHHLGVIYTSFAGYILITCIMFAGYLLKEYIGYRTSTVFSLCGAGLNIVSSVLIFSDRGHFRNRVFHPHMYLLPLLVACSVCAFINGIIFLIDAVATFKHKKDFGPK